LHPEAPHISGNSAKPATIYPPAAGLGTGNAGVLVALARAAGELNTGRC
jgi:hypothetical protein